MGQSMQGNGWGRRWRQAIALTIGLASGWPAVGLSPLGLTSPTGLALAQSHGRLSNADHSHRQAPLSEILLMAQASSPPRRFEAATPQPRGRGYYVSSEGGGVRNGCAGDQRIAAMAPSTKKDPGSNFEIAETGGYTTQSRPDLWAYIPYAPEELNGSSSVTLVFHQAVVDTAGKRVLGEKISTHNLPSPSQAGLMKLSLPEADSLEEGEGFYWTIEVEVKCPDQAAPRKEAATAWIERLPTPGALSELGEEATGLDLAQFFHEADIWYDALEQMVQLRADTTANRGDKSETTAQWNSFLESYALEVGLEMPSNENLAHDL